MYSIYFHAHPHWLKIPITISSYLRSVVVENVREDMDMCLGRVRVLCMRVYNMKNMEIEEITSASNVLLCLTVPYLPYLHIFYTFWLFQLRICTHNFLFFFGEILAFIGL